MIVVQKIYHIWYRYAIHVILSVVLQVFNRQKWIFGVGEGNPLLRNSGYLYPQKLESDIHEYSNFHENFTLSIKLSIKDKQVYFNGE